MKKKLIFGSVCLGLVLVLSACGTSTSQPNGTAENRPDRRPDFGQPKTQPEIRGFVKSVVGNEVTVLKIDQMQRATSTDANVDKNATDNKTKLSLGGSNVPQGMPSGGMGGARPDGGGMGGFPGGAPGGTGGGDTDRTALLAQMKAMSTGEETITIPVGIKMLKSSTDGSRTMVEANISDVTTDKTITVWLNSAVTDKKVASFVLIN